MAKSENRKSFYVGFGNILFDYLLLNITADKLNLQSWVSQNLHQTLPWQFSIFIYEIIN